MKKDDGRRAFKLVEERGWMGEIVWCMRSDLPTWAREFHESEYGDIFWWFSVVRVFVRDASDYLLSKVSVKKKKAGEEWYWKVLNLEYKIGKSYDNQDE